MTLFRSIRTLSSYKFNKFTCQQLRVEGITKSTNFHPDLQVHLEVAQCQEVGQTLAILALYQQSEKYNNNHRIKLKLYLLHMRRNLQALNKSFLLLEMACIHYD